MYDTIGICFPKKRTFVERDTTLRNSLCLADCQIGLAHLPYNIQIFPLASKVDPFDIIFKSFDEF